MHENLLNKITTFLEKELEQVTSPQEVTNRQEIINYFKDSKGHCHGMAILQAYGRRIDDEDASATPKKAEIDDIHFFNKTKSTLLNWNGTDELATQQRQDIERLISNILLYQRAQYAFSKFAFDQDPAGKLVEDQAVLQDTIRGELTKSFDYNVGLIASKEMLNTRLQQVVKPRSIILINSKSENGHHTTAIYQNRDGTMYFFNNENEVVAKDFDALTEELWGATDPTNFRSGLAGVKISDRYLRNIAGIEVFKFANDPQYEYPVHEDLQITKDEFKNFSEAVPNLVKFANRDKLFGDFLYSTSRLDAEYLYQDPSIKNEDLKTALLSRLSIYEKSYKAPLLAMHQAVMSKDMMQDRLDKLDKPEIGSITVTCEIGGLKRCIAGIGRYGDKLHLSLPSLESQNSFDCQNMNQAVSLIWENYAPSNFRQGPIYRPAEIYFRKCDIHVFDNLKNKDAKKVCPSSEEFAVTAPELENFREKKGSLFQNPKIKYDPLFLAFINQFPPSEEIEPISGEQFDQSNSIDFHK